MFKVFVNVVIMMILLNTISMIYGREQIVVTSVLIKRDNDELKKYIMETVANQIKQAKSAGKGLVRAIGGISNYAYDSIPWLFFDDKMSIEKAFERLCEVACVRYIQDGKSAYRDTFQRKKQRINKGQLGEFLHRRIIDILNISADDKRILKDEPAKTDDYMQRGIINKDDYMFYNVLNLIIQYYLEKECGKRR